MRSRAGARGVYLLLLPIVGLLVGFFVIPLVEVLWGSVGGADMSLSAYQEFFSTPAYVQVLLQTVRVAFIVTLSCLLLGYPMAYVMSVTSGATRTLLMLSVMFPFWLSSLIRAYSWQAILQRRGAVNYLLLELGLVSQPLEMLYTLYAVCFCLTYVLLPFMILPIYAGIMSVDPSLPRASLSLGAGPVRTFVRVFFPLTLSGVWAGSILVFILAIGAYITPALLGGAENLTLPILIERQVVSLSNLQLGSAMATILAVVALVLFLIYWRLYGSGRGAMWKL